MEPLSGGMEEKMKAFVLGAGAQGATTASILAKDERAEKIVLADINLEAAEKVRDKIGSEKVSAIKTDATDIGQIAEAAQGCDVIFDLSMTWLTVNVMKAALKVKAHYVNTAFDEPFWGQILRGESLELADEFKEAGLTALLGCGGTPGMLNVYVRRYCDKLDSVESIKLRGGSYSKTPMPLIGPWDPGWAPAQALIDYITEPVQFKDSKFEKTAIFAEPEEFDFGPGVGKIWIAHHSHEETYSLPYTIGKGISHCEFKYDLDVKAGTFISMGFTPDNEIEVKGTKIKPFDVLIALTDNPGDMFLAEEPPSQKELNYGYMSFIEIEGEKDGAEKSFKVQVPPLDQDALATYEACGTVMVYVSLPAVLGGVMCLEGTETGVIFAEQLDPERFIELLNEKFPYDVNEL